MLCSAIVCIIAFLVVYPVADDERKLNGEMSPVTVHSFKRYYSPIFADNPKQQAPTVKKRRIRTS